MNYKIVTGIGNIDRKAWKDFVDIHPRGTVFQSPGMHDLFESAEKMEPVALACVDEENKMAGILLGVVIRERNGPAGYFSRRTVVYGGPVVRAGKDGHAITDLLLKALIHEVGKRSVFIQFRNFHNMEEYRGVFEKNGLRLHDRLNLLVDTSSPGVVNRNMSESRRRQVRKSLEQGAVSREAKSLDEVRIFYNILRDLYKNKVKKPLPGWSFFEGFYWLSNNGMEPGVILLVEYQGRIVGGILCPVTPGRVIYEWYVCGLDQEYRNIYPSVVATWAALDYAVKSNIPSFDFMGVGLPNRPYGVRDFKKRFGGETVNFGRFSRINNRTLYQVAELGYNILALLKRI